MTKEDFKSEVFLKILEDYTKWETTRDKSTNTTLIYTALKNKVRDTWMREIKRALPYDKDECILAVKESITNKHGLPYNYYKNQTNNIQQYLKETLINPPQNQTQTKKALSNKHNLTNQLTHKKETQLLNYGRLYIKEKEKQLY